MKLTNEEIRARLAAAPEHDVCVLRIEDGDYGCEEPPEIPALWLQLCDREGQLMVREIPEPVINTLGLTEGCTCKLEQLGNHGEVRHAL